MLMVPEELATNPNSLLTPEISLYNPETPDYVYDLEKAKSLQNPPVWKA